MFAHARQKPAPAARRSEAAPTREVRPSTIARVSRPATGHELAAVAGRRGSAVQAELRVGPTDDPLEREAERVAARFARGPTARPEHGAAASGGRAPAPVEASLGRPGRPLEPATRALAESKLGHDFSDVRVHVDRDAAASADAISANAYTSGSDIVFAAGRYAPDTPRGLRLLGHELAHVVQQREARSSSTAARSAGELVADEDREPLAGAGVVQRDFASPVPKPGAAPRDLTADEIKNAIVFNAGVLTSATEISDLRDVLGISPQPAVVDADFVQALVRFQAQFDVAQTGRLDAATASRLSREYRAEAAFLGAGGAALAQEARRLDMRTLTITPGAAKELTTRGSAEFPVTWSIPDPNANGWIIQHVQFGGHKTDCDGNDVATNLGTDEYWEGWQVRNGQVFVGSTANAHRADTFRTPSEGASTRGVSTITGHVTYIPNYDLKEPPWGHTVAAAGDLPTMTAAPPGWDDGLAREHRLRVEWDDCAKPPTHTFTVAP
jgi:hypothetical protein